MSFIGRSAHREMGVFGGSSLVTDHPSQWDIEPEYKAPIQVEHPVENVLELREQGIPAIADLIGRLWLNGVDISEFRARFNAIQLEQQADLRSAQAGELRSIIEFLCLRHGCIEQDEIIVVNRSEEA